MNEKLIELWTALKNSPTKIWTWLQDNPIHSIIAAAAIIACAIYWKAVVGIAFWFMVIGGGLALAFYGYKWWKNRKTVV
jgi:hypothetical protein